MKVISFKVNDKTYYVLKKKKVSFRSIFEPIAIEIANNNGRGKKYTPVYKRSVSIRIGEKKREESVRMTIPPSVCAHLQTQAMSSDTPSSRCRSLNRGPFSPYRSDPVCTARP